ncbi:hypothetical protein SDC9_77515 [bioreactor metagenome]|uniref:Uncharacterized protein n=1 Tax=bioreactor metagenome TaxID=1076179 RepID=A0A644YQS2_9ZZZZ
MRVEGDAALLRPPGEGFVEGVRIGVGGNHVGQHHHQHPLSSRTPPAPGLPGGPPPSWSGAVVVRCRRRPVPSWSGAVADRDERGDHGRSLHPADQVRRPDPGSGRTATPRRHGTMTAGRPDRPAPPSRTRRRRAGRGGPDGQQTGRTRRDGPETA